MKSNLAVYGMSGCVWWDTIDKVSTREGLPCCPHCGSMLLQMDLKEWWNGVNQYEHAGIDDYHDFICWLRGKCFKTLNAAIEQYNA